ncbi:MAG: hypothetical protein WCH79_08120 [Planctomycetia bacterium]
MAKKKAAKARGTRKKSTPRKPSTRPLPAAAKPVREQNGLVIDMTDVTMTYKGKTVTGFRISAADKDTNDLRNVKKTGTIGPVTPSYQADIDATRQCVVQIDAEESLLRGGPLTAAGKLRITITPVTKP